MDRDTEVGKKFDKGKAPMYTGVIAYFPKALEAVAQISAYGANKYKLNLADKNWMKVPDGYARYTDALARHLGDSVSHVKDLESNLLVDAHAAWNALARLELLLHTLEAANTKAKEEYPDAQASDHPDRPGMWSPKRMLPVTG
jgi:hypothetical protein